MADKGDLAFVQAEIVSLTRRYPELPGFQRNGYEGWFAEAKKQFQMQSYNRSQDERIAVLKRIAELNDLYLRIDQQQLTYARQQEQKLTYEQEQRLRGKRLNVDELKVDQEMEELVYEGERKRGERTKVVVAAKVPRDPVEEELTKIRRTLRTVAGVEAEGEQLAKDYPEHAPYIRQQCRKIIADLMERV